MNVSIWKLLHRLLEIGGEQKRRRKIYLFEFLHDKEHKLDEEVLLVIHLVLKSDFKVIFNWGYSCFTI